MLFCFLGSTFLLTKTLKPSFKRPNEPWRNCTIFIIYCTIHLSYGTICPEGNAWCTFFYCTLSDSLHQERTYTHTYIHHINLPACTLTITQTQSLSLSLSHPHTHTHKYTSKHYPCTNQAQGYYVWVCYCFLATSGTCSTKMLLSSRVFFKCPKTELAKRKALLVEWGKTWSCGTIWCLLFAVNMIPNLPIKKWYNHMHPDKSWNQNDLNNFSQQP